MKIKQEVFDNMMIGVMNSDGFVNEREDCLHRGVVATSAQDNDERAQRQRLWEAWLFLEATREGFTSAQVHAAAQIWQNVPTRFTDVPSAAKDEDGHLCLTWRSDPWTLSIEINLDGQSDWWAYSSDTQHDVDGREAIFAAVG